MRFRKVLDIRDVSGCGVYLFRAALYECEDQVPANSPAASRDQSRCPFNIHSLYPVSILGFVDSVVKPISIRFWKWYRLNQRLSVPPSWLREHPCNGSRFDLSAIEQNDNFIADTAHDRKVMTDEDKA